MRLLLMCETRETISDGVKIQKDSPLRPSEEYNIVMNKTEGNTAQSFYTMENSKRAKQAKAEKQRQQ